jgi:hypothetical protein
MSNSKFAPVPTFGLATTSQAEPFHRSIRVWSTPFKLYTPAAQTSPADADVTAYRTLLPGPTFGLETMLQTLPFQCSTRLWTTLFTV